MALTNNGTKVSLPSGQIPAGFAAPAVTEFSDYEYIQDLVLSVPKATVQAAAKEATLLAVINNATVGIAKQVDDLMAADFISTNTVTYYIDFIKLGHNVNPNASSDFLNNSAVNYVCTVKVYIKTA